MKEDGKKQEISQYDVVLQAAELALKESDRSRQLLHELLQGLDINAGVVQSVCHPEKLSLTQGVKAEFFQEMHHPGSGPCALQEIQQKTRPRRPVLMRGMRI